MPYINLIQEQRAAAHKNEQQARVAFFAFVGCAVATVCAYGYLAFEKELIRSQVARIQADEQKLDPLLKKIDANQKAADTFRPRLDTLKQAQLDSDRWARLMSHLQIQTPPTVWLTRIHCDQQDAQKPVQVVMNGLCPKQEPVGEFMLRVQNERDLDNVNLRYTQEKQEPHRRLVDFEIGADLTGTAEAPPKKTDDGTTPAEGAKA